MILHAIHPTPVLRVPHGKRSERLEFERTVTAVEVPEASPSEMDEANPILLGGVQERGGARPALHDGKLYRPLSSDGRDTNALDLASVLEGRALPGSSDPRWHHWMRFHMRGSPLFAPFVTLQRHGSPRDDYRGDVLPPPRSVRHNAGETASSAIRAYASEDLLLVGGVPHVRVVPLASARRKAHGVEVSIRHRAGVPDLEDLPVGPGDLDAVIDAIPERFARGDHLGTEVFLAWRDLPASVFGDRAAVLAANNVPFLMGRERGHWLGGRPVDAWPDTEMFEVHGLAGLVSGEAAGAALAAAAGQARAMLATGDRCVGLSKVPDALRTIESAYLPGYRPTAEAAMVEDADAFAALGP